jgi:hypothetical protein
MLVGKVTAMVRDAAWIGSAWAAVVLLAVILLMLLFAPLIVLACALYGGLRG